MEDVCSLAGLTNLTSELQNGKRGAFMLQNGWGGGSYTP